MSLDTNKLIELEGFKSNWDQINNDSTQSHVVKGSHCYYHYTCDGASDMGWGCGYRTLQTMCSWVRMQLSEEEQGRTHVPSILEIQKILVECGDKPASFIGSKEWIGCFEASIVIDYIYDLPCKILHCKSGKLADNLATLRDHFKTVQSPIMMGGDTDNASKGILGVCDSYDNFGGISKTHLLVANPHYSDKKEAKEECLVKEGWIKWTESTVFEESSFYNFCMPQRVQPLADQVEK